MLTVSVCQAVCCLVSKPTGQVTHAAKSRPPLVSSWMSGGVSLSTMGSDMSGDTHISWTRSGGRPGKTLTEPLHWRKPCTIFVNSMSDTFHSDVPDEFLDQMFAVMALAHWHRFMVL